MSSITLHPMSDRSSIAEYLFYFIVPLVTALFFGAGQYMRGVPEPEVPAVKSTVKVVSRIHLSEPEKPLPPPKVIAERKKKIPEKPVDLTTEPVLNQMVPEEEPPATESSKKVRRVYGLRKVYSRGLGTGGRLSDAVVAKLGNTINKEIDTIKATAGDIKGRVTSAVTVTAPPRIKKQYAPAYSAVMKEHQITGKVQARVLVDIDGKAKKIIITHDLGFGTKEASIEAINKMLFEPAKIDDEPVAVWIPLTFRFEFYV